MLVHAQFLPGAVWVGQFLFTQDPFRHIAAEFAAWHSESLLQASPQSLTVGPVVVFPPPGGLQQICPLPQEPAPSGLPTEPQLFIVVLVPGYVEPRVKQSPEQEPPFVAGVGVGFETLVPGVGLIPAVLRQDCWEAVSDKARQSRLHPHELA